jgi:hypothetical protein
MHWWMMKEDRKALGPLSTEQLLRDIGAGQVPRDALVCAVGGTAWKWIGEVPPFSAAIDEGFASDEGEEVTAEHRRTAADSSNGFEGPEHTSVDRSSLSLSEPPRRSWLDRLDDGEEKTIEDVVPLPSSDPPSDP